MEISVDDRVGAVELARYLPQSLVEIKHLEYADAAFLGRGPDDFPMTVGVERKTIPDLINSMETGRLSGHQLLGLRSYYQVVYLLLEGPFRASKEGVLEIPRGRKGNRPAWRPAGYGGRAYMVGDITNYINSLAIVCGLHVWRTLDIRESARWILSTYRWWQKVWKDHRSHLRFNIGGPASPPDGATAELLRPNLTRRIAKELPHVGWERAKALADAFPTPLELALASEEELESIPGIGSGIASKIVRAFQKGG